MIGTAGHSAAGKSPASRPTFNLWTWNQDGRKVDGTGARSMDLATRHGLDRAGISRRQICMTCFSPPMEKCYKAGGSDGDKA